MPVRSMFRFVTPVAPSRFEVELVQDWVSCDSGGLSLRWSHFRPNAKQTAPSENPHISPQSPKHIRFVPYVNRLSLVRKLFRDAAE